MNGRSENSDSRVWDAQRVEPNGAERFEVDGETFTVRADDGQYHFEWLSGRNPGYGFSCRTSDGRSLTRRQMVNQIRTFLRQIDSETGYIED